MPDEANAHTIKPLNERQVRLTTVCDEVAAKCNPSSILSFMAAYVKVTLCRNAVDDDTLRVLTLTV